MVEEITWSPKAIITYDAVIVYLQEEWTEREVINFVTRVDKKLKLLQTHPRIGVVTGKKS
jgi:plasmid stabilization system protein ParE